jgi:hypothetical protein
MYKVVVFYGTLSFIQFNRMSTWHINVSLDNNEHDNTQVVMTGSNSFTKVAERSCATYIKLSYACGPHEDINLAHLMSQSRK